MIYSLESIVHSLYPIVCTLYSILLYTLCSILNFTLPSPLNWRLPWCNQPTGLKTSGLLPLKNQTVQTRKHTVQLSCLVSFFRRFFFLVVFQNLKTPKWTVWVFDFSKSCCAQLYFDVFKIKFAHFQTEITHHIYPAQCPSPVPAAQFMAWPNPRSASYVPLNFCVPQDTDLDLCRRKKCREMPWVLELSRLACWGWIPAIEHGWSWFFGPPLRAPKSVTA